MEKNELLEYVKEIKTLEKKRIFWTRIAVALVAVLVVGLLSTLPLIIKTLNNANDAMDSATEALSKANKTLDQADDIMDDLTGTVDTMETALDSITSLVNDSSESLKTAFDNINSINFEGLNDAITNLGDVVEPLSKFFRKF